MNNNNTHELSKFKEEAREYYTLLFYHNKKKVNYYRVIFIVLSLLFFVLAWIVWSKSSLWITSSIKPFVDFFSLSLGFLALLIAYLLNTQKEAVRALYHHTVRTLRQTYKIRQTKVLKDPNLPLSETIRKKLALRAHFNQTKEKLRHLEIESYELMDQIAHTKGLSAQEKEVLYDQTLIELKNKYDPVVKKYLEQNYIK